MEKFIFILKNSSLFENIEDSEILTVLKCMSARIRKFQKDQAIFLQGDAISEVGIIVSGKAIIKRADLDGNEQVLTELHSSDLFGEAFVCGEIKELPVSVWAIKETEVIFIDYKKILNMCSANCSFHSKLLSNMLKLMAKKIILLNQKIDIIQKTSIRSKALAFLQICSNNAGRPTFAIPFKRAELAQYLGVNKSALSRVLSQMQQEGIIEFRGNKFSLK